jgi:hypothetical protein
MSVPSWNPVTDMSGMDVSGAYATNQTFHDVSYTQPDGSYSLVNAINSLPPDVSAVAGAQYAFEATGGFFTNETFATILQQGQDVVQTYDTTGAVEVQLPVSFFNIRKLGIKDGKTNPNFWDATANQYTNQYFYDSSSDMLKVDNFSVSASEFFTALGNGYNNTPTAYAFKNITSVGKLSTIYSDFGSYVATYFGIASNQATGSASQSPNPVDGYATLFSDEYNFNPNGGVFGSLQLYNLFQGDSSFNEFKNHTNDGSYNVGIGGQIDLSNITQLLRDAVSADPFKNRPVYSDPVNKVPTNYGVSTGFMANDLIFIPHSGISVTMNLIIDNEAYMSPLNNPSPLYTNPNTTNTANPYFGQANYPGQAYDGNFTANIDASGSTLAYDISANAWLNTSKFTSATTVSTTLITRVMTAPLLIRMVDDSDMN